VILDTAKSLTGAYLRGELKIPLPKTRRAPNAAGSQSLALASTI